MLAQSLSIILSAALATHPSWVFFTTYTSNSLNPYVSSTLYGLLTTDYSYDANEIGTVSP